MQQPLPTRPKTMLWKYFQICMYSFRKLKKSHNLACCSSLQPVVVYNFSEIESTFPVPFLKLRGQLLMASWHGFHLIRKGKYDWFLHEWLLLDWHIFLLYLLQYVCCSKYSAKTTNFSTLNVFLYSLHQFVRKHLRIFVTVIRKFFTRGT